MDKNNVASVMAEFLARLEKLVDAADRDEGLDITDMTDGEICRWLSVRRTVP